jgi:hypothetical protein
MNGVMHQGIPGLYTLGANDIFEYLASVSNLSLSPNTGILKPNSHSFKSTVANCMTCSISVPNSNSGKTTKTILTSSDSRKHQSIPPNNSSSTWHRAPRKGLPLKIRPMQTPLALTLSSRLLSKTVKNFLERFHSSTSLVMSVVLIIWI